MTPSSNTGYDALKSMAIAGRFNQWMYHSIRPYTYGNILEIGSGIGNISRFFIEDGSSITLSDIDNNYNQLLGKEFPILFQEKKILSIDLQKQNFNEAYNELNEKFDTVFLLNVLEHLLDESAAIQNCRHLLKKGGTLIILVPAYKILFSEQDKSLGHYRRYTKKQLTSVIKEGNFHTQKTFYFNALGIIAWLYGKIMKFKYPPNSSMRFYDKLVQAGKILDNIVFNRIGLSVIVIAKKV